MKKILIIEDELAYLNLLFDRLHAKGYAVIEAKNGEEGLKKALSEKPDLILLDLRMPVMDGAAMLQLLRKDDEGKKIQVIILTNLEPDDEIIGKVLVDQLAYYFVKSDIELNDLLKKIEKLLKK